jgi:hypothetical protein
MVLLLLVIISHVVRSLAVGVRGRGLQGSVSLERKAIWMFLSVIRRLVEATFIVLVVLGSVNKTAF